MHPDEAVFRFKRMLRYYIQGQTSIWSEALLKGHMTDFVLIVAVKITDPWTHLKQFNKITLISVLLFWSDTWENFI